MTSGKTTTFAMTKLQEAGVYSLYDVKLICMPDYKGYLNCKADCEVKHGIEPCLLKLGHIHVRKKWESLREFTGATLMFTLACIRAICISKFVAWHENLFYRKYPVEKKHCLMNNVKSKDVRESRILNSWEFSNLANINIGWQMLFETFCFVASYIKAVIKFLVMSFHYLSGNIWSFL